MAYVVIQHLDPDHPSLLIELLARKTTMPVVAVHEGLGIEAAHVYVIPPNSALTLSQDRFHLGPRESGSFHPIDTFMVSLADSRAEAAIGVVLSGANPVGDANLISYLRDLLGVYRDVGKFRGFESLSPPNSPAIGYLRFVITHWSQRRNNAERPAIFPDVGPAERRCPLSRVLS